MEQLAVSELQHITVEIKLLKQQTAENLVKIGMRLIEAKDQLEHGAWLDWLNREDLFSDRQARRLMKVARDAANWTTLSDLNPSQAFALLDMPVDERDEFAKSTHVLPSGEVKQVTDMSVREIEQAKQAQREAERRAEEAERQLIRATQEASLVQKQAASLVDRANKYREENERLKAQKTLSPVTIVETKEVVPDDYEETKRRVQQMDLELKQKDEQIYAHTRDEISRANRFKVRDSIDDLTRQVGSFLTKVKLRVAENEMDMISDTELFRTATGAADILRDAADYLDSLVQAKSDIRKDVIWDAELIDA